MACIMYKSNCVHTQPGHENALTYSAMIYLGARCVEYSTTPSLVAATVRLWALRL